MKGSLADEVVMQVVVFLHGRLRRLSLLFVHAMEHCSVLTTEITINVDVSAAFGEITRLIVCEKSQCAVVGVKHLLHYGAAISQGPTLVSSLCTRKKFQSGSPPSRPGTGLLSWIITGMIHHAHYVLGCRISVFKPGLPNAKPCGHESSKNCAIFACSCTLGFRGMRGKGQLARYWPRRQKDCYDTAH